MSIEPDEKWWRVDVTIEWAAAPEVIADTEEEARLLAIEEVWTMFHQGQALMNDSLVVGKAERMEMP